jgi:putative membrane protein
MAHWPTPFLSDREKVNQMTRISYRRATLALAGLALVIGVAPVRAQSDGSPASGSSPALTSKASTLSSGDRTFMLRAAADELFEFEMSRLAMERTTADDLKAYATKMVGLHTEVQQQLNALAQAKGLVLPNTLGSMRQRELDRLQALSGEEFDREYFQRVGLRAHRQNIKLFRDASRLARDPDVRSWASKMAPAHEQHLADARALPSARWLTYTPYDPSNFPGGM